MTSCRVIEIDRGFKSTQCGKILALYLYVSKLWGGGFSRNLLYSLFFFIEDFNNPEDNHGLLATWSDLILYLNKGKHLLNVELNTSENDWYANSTSC